MSSVHKINILEITSTLGYAGSQRAMVNFCKYINRSFFTVYAAAYAAGGAREVDLKAMGVPYIVAQNSAEKIVQYISTYKIDVMHFHRSGHYVPLEYEIIKEVKKKFPHIVIVETNIFSKFDPISFPLIDCSLQISQMMMNERFVKKAGFFDAHKMKVLYYPVDYKAFEGSKASAEEISLYKKQLGIKPGDFVIGKMGRPDVAKWSDLLLDMMPYVVKKIPNLKFVIQAAPASRIKRIQHSAYAHNYILLKETADEKEVARFYGLLDVYVHASKIGESFGMTLAEAGVFKKPVIVNSTPKRDNAQVELIDHLTTGIIANTPQTFAQALEYLYNHPEKRQAMGEAAYTKVTTEFNPDITARRLEKIVLEIRKSKGLTIAKEMEDFYAGLISYPAVEDSKAFQVEYSKRLGQAFGRLRSKEKVVNFLKLPVRFYYKVRDFIEDKFHI